MKFYPLTLVLVLLLVLIGLEYNKNLDKRLVLTASFLLGIGSYIHHTSLMMTIPLFIENPIKLQAVSNELDFKCEYDENNGKITCNSVL